VRSSRPLTGGATAEGNSESKWLERSHASAFPELGINAADALTIAQTAIGLLRQHLRSSDRIHGFVTNGGVAPNVIPAHTSANYIIRSETLEQLTELRPKVHRCFEAGAHATGARVAITGGDRPYAEMRHDDTMAIFYRRNSEALGRPFPNLGEWETRPTRFHRHGQRVSGGTVDPSHDRHQFLARRQSSAGVHGALHNPGCRQSADRWRNGNGLDVHRPGDGHRSPATPHRSSLTAPDGRSSIGWCRAPPGVRR
jgi:hypothetical protein